MLKIDFENQILALFDIYFWPFNKSHEKINTFFFDQCNHSFNLKCFFQIPLTWWKTYEGAISFTPSIESMKDGFTGYGNNSDERVSFMKVVGYYWSNVIPATTITYIMKFDFELQNQNIKPSSLSKRFSEKLYLNEELSDVKIICEDKVFDCHKLILSQSDVFKSMLIESKMLEQSSREVKITDFPATAIESLIYYFYHDDFPETKVGD